MLATAIARASAITRPYLRGYAAVLFCSHDLAGLLILAVTFVRPEVGAAGLLAAVVAHLTARHLNYAELEQPPEIYNAVLVGLALGSVWELTPLLLAIIAVVSVVTALATHVMAGWLWRLNRLPVMSLTFVLIVWALLLAARDVEVLTRATHDPFPAFEPAWLNDFFTALGWFLFTPHPVTGLAMFAALLIASRYLALLCVAGYVVGALALWAVGSSVPSGVVGFNFMLAAMAVGGLFAFPDRVSFLWGLFAALIAALLSVALGPLLGNLQLPALAAPFLLASYLLLAGLSARPAGKSPHLLLEAPALPERSLLAAKLARARLGEPGSYAVSPPFFGTWNVSQAIDGEHTHRGHWRHAFDFMVHDERGSSFRGAGTSLDEYYAFGAPVLAPVSGTVWRADDRMPDNAPGDVDTRPGRNFGNHLMIRTVDGVYVLVGHLKQNSLTVKPGAWVEVGQIVAACGNSGRSAEPHIHLQVQWLPDLGAPTRSLHLRSITVHPKADFLLTAQPGKGWSVSAAVRDERLGEAMHLQAGRSLTFAADDGTQHALATELTLLGQFRLRGETGASATYEERPDVIAFFDRQGVRDRGLDAWLLAIGLTPLSTNARAWTDAPSVTLATLPPMLRLVVLLLRPFGATFESRYRRVWESGRGVWCQSGTHTLPLAFGLTVEVATDALIDPKLGVTFISVSGRHQAKHFTLRATGAIASATDKASQP